MCTKLGVTGAITKPEHFKLVQGEASLTSYARHPDIALRSFCKVCGIHCFSKGTLPELGGAFVGVHVNALDDVDLGELTFLYWDGRHDNWQAGLRPAPWPVFTKAA
jgi:hypothetical protein